MGSMLSHNPVRAYLSFSLSPGRAHDGGIIEVWYLNVSATPGNKYK
jgi:hypothetical protein